MTTALPVAPASLPGASLADRLKQETAALHRHAEQRPLQQDAVRGTVDRAAWARYLGDLALVHERLERLLDAAAGSVPAIDRLYQPFHRHAERARADRLVLEGPRGDAPMAAEAPVAAVAAFLDALDAAALARPIALLGALYVLEGSMNGNRFIARALAGAWGFRPGGPGLSYLDPHGAEQAARWGAFRGGLDALLLTEADRDAILDLAMTTFAAVAAIAESATEPR